MSLGKKSDTGPQVSHEEVGGSEDIPTWRFIVISVCLLVGLFLALMDTSIVATALFTITLEFGALGDVTWIILAYTLTYVGFAVIITRLADVTGRKITVMACLVIFLAASLGAGFSPSLDALIACRALQGIGGSGLYSMTLVVLAEASPVDKLPLMSAFIGLVVAVAGVLGPILGGVISTHTTWRWMFWLNGPVAGLILVAFFIACPRYLPGHHISKRKLREVDFVGGLLLLAAVILFVFGLQEAGIGTYEWSSPVIICTLLFGCLSGVLLAGWQYFAWHKYGKSIAMMLPVTVLQNRVLMAGVLYTICTGYTLFTCVFFIPLRFQIVNYNNSSEAGVHLVPLLAAGALGTVVGGALSTRQNFTTAQLAVSSMLLAIGDGLLSTLPADVAIPARAYGYQIIVGFGMGVGLSAVSVLTTLVAEFEDNAVAQGLTGQARLFGGSIGIAAASAIFNRRLKELTGLFTPDQITGLQTRFATTVVELNVDQLNAIRLVFVDAFNEALRFCAYIMIVGFAAALLTWQKHPLDPVVRKAEYAAESRRRRLEAARLGNSGTG